MSHVLRPRGVSIGATLLALPLLVAATPGLSSAKSYVGVTTDGDIHCLFMSRTSIFYTVPTRSQGGFAGKTFWYGDTSSSAWQWGKSASPDPSRPGPGNSRRLQVKIRTVPMGNKSAVRIQYRKSAAGRVSSSPLAVQVPNINSYGCPLD